MKRNLKDGKLNTRQRTRDKFILVSLNCPYKLHYMSQNPFFVWQNTNPTQKNKYETADEYNNNGNEFQPRPRRNVTYVRRRSNTIFSDSPVANSAATNILWYDCIVSVRILPHDFEMAKKLDLFRAFCSKKIKRSIRNVVVGAPFCFRARDSREGWKTNLRMRRVLHVILCVHVKSVVDLCIYFLINFGKNLYSNQWLRNV